MSDNNDIPECRICFDKETPDNPLISPCSCKGTSLYIHKSCLNDWRHFNVDGEAWRKCMECHTEYTFHRKYPIETFFYKNLSSLPYISIFENVILFFSSLIIWFIEFNNDYLAIRMLDFGIKSKNLSIINEIEQSVLLPQVFYYSYCSFLLNILFHIYFCYNIYYKVKRRNVYYEQIKERLIISILYNLNFVYFYYIFVWNNISILFLNFVTVCTFLTPYFHYKLIKNHNKIIINMNNENEEEVMSFNHNPLINIENQVENKIEMINVIIE